MNINAAFPSKYIKSAEVSEDGVTLSVHRVTSEDVDGKGTMKPVLYFNGVKKGLVLNVTNSKKIVTVLGTPETTDWEGQSITIYRSETDYQGETVDCIRVRTPKKGAKVAANLDASDIPF